MPADVLLDLRHARGRIDRHRNAPCEQDAEIRVEVLRAGRQHDRHRLARFQSRGAAGRRRRSRPVGADRHSVMWRFDAVADADDVHAIRMRAHVPCERLDERRGIVRECLRRLGPARRRGAGAAADEVSGASCSASRRSRSVTTSASAFSCSATPKARSTRTASSTRLRLSSPRSRSSALSSVTGRIHAAPGCNSASNCRVSASTDSGVRPLSGFSGTAGRTAIFPSSAKPACPVPEVPAPRARPFLERSAAVADCNCRSRPWSPPCTQQAIQALLQFSPFGLVPKRSEDPVFGDPLTWFRSKQVSRGACPERKLLSLTEMHDRYVEVHDPYSVVPAKAGTRRRRRKSLDPRLRGDHGSRADALTRFRNDRRGLPVTRRVWTAARPNGRLSGLAGRLRAGCGLRALGGFGRGALRGLCRRARAWRSSAGHALGRLGRRPLGHLGGLATRHRFWR